MKTRNMAEILDQYALDYDCTIKTLREIEYDFIQYNLNHSVEEEAHIHHQLPDKLYCLHSVIKIIEGDNSAL